MSARIAILLTSFNRKAKTLACLKQVFASPGISPYVILVDDGSTDGTSEAVAEQFPAVRVLHGDGNLFWNRGMHRAFDAALTMGFDHYLWLNDDTELYPNAIGDLLQQSKELGDRAVLVGSTCDPETKKLTYGGVIRTSKTAPLRFAMVEPGDRPKPCDTINGNCVLIPKAVADKVGNLDPFYQHGMGDFDYGLRAKKLGLECYVASGFVGECSRNPVANSWLDKKVGLRQRWKLATSRKGLPIRDWKYFSRHYAGPLWPLYFISPYIRLVLKLR